VTCIDGQINLSVNGAFVSGAYDVQPRKGYICLEAEGTEAEFKNIRIMELPPTAPAIPTDMIASEDQGFVTIFTGINLDGWNSDDMATWSAGGNVLECNEEGGTLQTTNSTGSYELMFDYKCLDESSTVYVVIDGKKTELPCNDVGQWTRFVIKGDCGMIGIGGNNAKFTNLFTRPI
jgi:hypothetical protein